MAASAESSAPVTDADLYLSFRLIKENDFEGARRRLDDGIARAKTAKNTVLEGLYLSAMGVLCKRRGDFRESYRYYQLAERCLPDDPSLKIITATLLIFEFNQHDTAIRKLEKILADAPVDASLTHHARALWGTAHLMAGKTEKAREALDALIDKGFAELKSAANINYKLPEQCVRKNFEPALCKRYLAQALELAKSRREEVYVRAIGEMLQQMDKL